jgi:hypothetical protein
LSSPGDFVTVVNTGSDWKTMAKRFYFSRCGQLLVLAGRPQELILTTDANDFVVKTNNSEALRITLRATGLGVTAFGLLAH